MTTTTTAHQRHQMTTANGHRVWCTNNRKPVGYRKPAAECRECGPHAHEDRR